MPKMWNSQFSLHIFQYFVAESNYFIHIQIEREKKSRFHYKYFRSVREALVTLL